MYLRLPGDYSDAVFTPLEPLIADERPDVDRNFHTTIFPSFHGKQQARGRERQQTERKFSERETEIGRNRVIRVQERSISE